MKYFKSQNKSKADFLPVIIIYLFKQIMEINREKTILELDEYISSCKFRLKNILDALGWNEEETMKQDTCLERLATDTSIDKNNPLLPESLGWKHSVVLDEEKLKLILKTDKVVIPQTFSDIQLNYTREQKLELYDYVIFNTGKISEPELKVAVANDMTFAEIVAKAKKRDKKQQRKYRTKKPTHIEEVRNLVHLQMQALQQYFGFEHTEKKTCYEDQNYDSRIRQRSKSPIGDKCGRFDRSRSRSKETRNTRKKVESCQESYNYQYKRRSRSRDRKDLRNKMSIKGEPYKTYRETHREMYENEKDWTSRSSSKNTKNWRNDMKAYEGNRGRSRYRSDKKIKTSSRSRSRNAKDLNKMYEELHETCRGYTSQKCEQKTHERSQSEEKRYQKKQSPSSGTSRSKNMKTKTQRSPSFEASRIKNKKTKLQGSSSSEVSRIKNKKTKLQRSPSSEASRSKKKKHQSRSKSRKKSHKNEKKHKHKHKKHHKSSP